MSPASGARQGVVRGVLKEVRQTLLAKGMAAPEQQRSPPLLRVGIFAHGAGGDAHPDLTSAGGVTRRCQLSSASCRVWQGGEGGGAEWLKRKTMRVWGAGGKMGSYSEAGGGGWGVGGVDEMKANLTKKGVLEARREGAQRADIRATGGCRG